MGIKPGNSKGPCLERGATSSCHDALQKPWKSTAKTQGVSGKCLDNGELAADQDRNGRPTLMQPTGHSESYEHPLQHVQRAALPSPLQMGSWIRSFLLVISSAGPGEVLPSRGLSEESIPLPITLCPPASHLSPPGCSKMRQLDHIDLEVLSSWKNLLF